MDKLKREKMVLAMEYICRQINDDEVFDSWLTLGVANEDLNYGEWDPDAVDDDYIDDNENFAELMGCFLRIMKSAAGSGGLYCDDVISR